MKFQFNVTVDGVEIFVDTDAISDVEYFLTRSRELKAAVVAEIIDNDEATTGTQALNAAAATPTPTPEVKPPKETTKQRARRKTNTRTETVVDDAQIEIPATSGKVIDLMDALKDSLAAAPAAPARIAPAPTEDAVFEAVKALAARKGVPAVHAVFAGFAIKKAGEISVEKRGELIAALVQAGSESAK